MTELVYMAARARRNSRSFYVKIPAEFIHSGMIDPDKPMLIKITQEEKQ